MFFPGHEADGFAAVNSNTALVGLFSGQDEFAPQRVNRKGTHKGRPYGTVRFATG